MNAPRTYALISGAGFISALFFFAIYNQWIIIRAPMWVHDVIDTGAIIHKKQVTHYYFHGDKWKTEKQEMLWTESVEKNIFQLINAWLIVLDEEHVIAKKTMLQSALISTADYVYLSFDHNFLGKEETVFKKWMLIEGLLKTIAANGISVSHVQMFVQHQQFHDAHLDFSLAWPIHGFIA